jgi:hypothetical protein
MAGLAASSAIHPGISSRPQSIGTPGERSGSGLLLEARGFRLDDFSQPPPAIERASVLTVHTNIGQQELVDYLARDTINNK